MGGFWNFITGRDIKRQKRIYNESRDRYSSYASEAQNTINNLSQQLQHVQQGLHSLEEQKYQASSRSYDMQNQLDYHSRQYESGLRNIESQRASLTTSAEQLKQAFAAFTQKSPALDAKISEVEQLPGQFQNLYDQVAQRRESLKGLTEEEAGSHINKYKQDVELLKNQRSETESKIRHSMDSITKEHQQLTREKANLEYQLSNYQSQQNRLLQETSNFDNARQQLLSMIEQYKQEQNRQEQITADYTRQQSHAEGLQNQLRSYGAAAQSQLDSYARDLEWRAGKYQKSARETGLVRGLGLAALTLGLGGGAVLGGLIGIGHYMNTANIGHKLGFERINLNNNDPSIGADLSRIARYGPSGLDKRAIPELGGLKQALEHFGMRSVPRLKDLPPLHESLGKIVSLKDIEGLTLGLPSMTAASGKKYNYEVLYDNEFIKKLKKVSKKLGTPYLNPNSTINLNATRTNYNNTNMVTSYG
ncbi:hypothetical protein [Candidatus Tisiphia endosymbiont of Thecophora atra]|uniref:hypothetical protein n=1 Tax=Candidatus Tisiphia endosymbiont of Thecophora atra TaxID=3066258 RepID=UPI00312C762B